MASEKGCALCISIRWFVLHVSIAIDADVTITDGFRIVEQNFLVFLLLGAFPFPQ